MRAGNSRMHNKTKLFNNSVSAYMEQTNLFSLPYKRKMCESTKVIPLYLKSIEKYQFFFDSGVESFNITKDEYLNICENVQELFSKIESTNLKTRKLWILKRLGRIGIVIVFLTLILFMTMVIVVIANFDKFIAIFLSLLFILYFVVVGIFCIFYMVKVFKTDELSDEHIKQLNMYIFKINIQYRDRGIELSLQTSSKELTIQKIL